MGSSERKTVARLFRDETAQTLGFVLVQLAALERLDNFDGLHSGVMELREAVRPELERIVQLVSELESNGRRRLRPPQPRVESALRD
jgi:nitrate/nitrite-specific signal transduction histidine kinase